MFNFRIWEKLFGSSGLPPSPENRAKESINQLNINASEYIVLFKQHHQNMLQSVQNYRKTSERIKQHQYTLKACFGFSVLLGILTAIFAVAMFLHPIHRKALKLYLYFYSGISEEMQGQPIPIDLAILLILAAPSVVFFVITQIEKVQIVHTVNLSIRDFRRKVSLLNVKLEKVKSVCEEMRRRSWSVLGGPDRVNLMRLEQSILEMFVLTEGLRTSACADSLTQVYEEYSKTFSELDKMKVQLSCYAGSGIILEPNVYTEE